MKLSYRGNEYDYTPPTVDMQEGAILGKYRGQTQALMSYPRHIPVPQVPMDLKYRGVAYRTHQTEEPNFPTCKAKPIAPNVVTTAPREVAQIHRSNLMARLQHRMEVARAKGDRDLLRQLELELQQLA